ncbi:MAG: putative glutamine-dependent synthetase, partial [Pseudomonadota bacterium]
ADQDISAGQGDPFDYPYHDALFKLWVESWDRFDFERTLQAWNDGSLAGLLGLESQSMLDAKFPTAQKFEADLERWWRAYTGMGAFKRMQAPPVFALSRRAFGFDHREAIGLHLMRGK